MAKFFTEIDSEIRDFIGRQKIFFTATAPHHGRINLSPKGIDTLRIVDAHTVAYLDLTGSGNETAAHIQDDGRLTLMLCSFDTQPLILRLYGHGEVVHPTDAQWATLAPLFPTLPGVRQIIVLHVDSLQTSCGFAIPMYEFIAERDTLNQWAAKKGPEGISQYHHDRNRTSIDGLPTGIEPLS